MNLLTPQLPFGPTNPAIPMASTPVQGDFSTPPTQADVVALHPEDTIALTPQAAALTAPDASAPPTIDPSAPIGSDQPDLTSQYAYKDCVDFTQGGIPSGYSVGNDTFHGGNGELQQYSPSQVTAVAGQGVVLTAAPNGDPNTAQDSPYVSGKVFDAQRGVSTGAVEFTATIPKGKGLWPAMWLLPKGQNAADGSDLQWPQTGEIDVSEIKGSDTTRSLATLHWGDAPGSPSKSQGPFATTDATTDFADGNPHRFAAQWDSNGITSYVDGKKVGYTPFDDQQRATFASGQQFSPIINLAVG
ncbi:MAG: glycoside hydrolase family 16 protein, partial [Proteobacteria bacterium]|nr:glycoside hydrolase family 16 protein [Pseudomonadota bacterium]